MATIDAARADGSADAREVLRVLLRSRSGAVRAEAAEALGELGDRGGLPALVIASADRDWMVRLCVAEALGAIGTPAVRAPLLRLLRDRNGLVRGTAALALAEAGLGHDAIRRRLRSERDDHASLRMLVAMRRLRASTRLLELPAFLNAPDYRVRIAVVQLASDLELSPAEHSMMSKAIDARLRVEKEPAVRSTLKDAVSSR